MIPLITILNEDEKNTEICIDSKTIIPTTSNNKNFSYRSPDGSYHRNTILISILSENDNKICHLLKFFIVSAFFSFLVIASIIFGLIDLRIFIGDFCFYAIFITTFYFMTCFLTKDISKLYFSLSRYYLFSYVSFYFILKGKARF